MTIAKTSAVTWTETLASKFVALPPELEGPTVRVRLAKSITLDNGDSIRPKSFVIINRVFARVHEILIRRENKTLIGILVQMHALGSIVEPYQLPKLDPTSLWDIVPIEASAFHVYDFMNIH
jgi:hypothetical protein